MSMKFNAIKTLYRTKRINIDGVRQAVVNGIITEDQFTEITGEKY